MDGNWSYYLGSPVMGHPADCAVDTTQEIGARNAAAPPWEGRMIAFGPPTMDTAAQAARNAQIQEVLLSTRPYGATPIAGQLDDARQFLWNDVSPDPITGAATCSSAASSGCFGPSNDPNWRAPNCRKSILILLTDGEPNLDLRPSCGDTPSAGNAGHCPYDKPELIVKALRDSPPVTSLSVETYVIGFALGRVTPYLGTQISCSALTDTQCADPHNNDPALPESARIQACCTLNKIAANGGVDATNTPRRAYFAENRDELRAIFTDILDDVVQVATRTMPVFSSPGGDTASKGFKFFSAFDPRPDPAAPALWEGVLERKRFVCTDLVSSEQFDATKGDDFAANLNSNTGDARHFYSFLPSGGGSSRNSIRPQIAIDPDGIGISNGTEVYADQPSALSPLIPAAAMELTAASCEGTALATDCRDLVVQHAVGLTTPGKPTRCPPSGCRLLGGIYHSTPTVVSGRPADLLRDESYGAFATEMAGDARPSALYTSTVDGFLHAFNLAPFPGSTGAASREVKTKTNNELWAFIPPAVLPVMRVQYPSTPAVLLDGVPVIKDVVSYVSNGVNRFERLQSDARAGAGKWRTVLVQGFGSESQVDGGYFALDITKPDRRDGGKPTFLWQITRDASGRPLFGHGGTPLITTVFLDDAANVPREVAVAVLPGGDASPLAGDVGTIGTIMNTDPGTFKTTRRVRDYSSAAALPARSLTIVRLDTGAIIRTFRPSAAAGFFTPAVFAGTVIPAPIIGQPKAYPELTGAVADRIFVGDRDGRLWRLDVSARNPANWTMKVFFDAFTGGVATDSQPVVLAPVLSVNDDGNLTVAFATGDQETAAASPTTVNRVVSLTETIDSVANDFIAHLNWIQSLTNGDRVTGPMVLFNRALYYAASRPPSSSAAACDIGQSQVFGAHFVDNLDVSHASLTPSPLSGPAPAPGATSLVITSKPGLVFGVSLEAAPSCASAQETITGNDSFGYGTVSMSTTVTPARFFLTFEVSGNSSDPRGVLEVRQELANPHLPVTFESWALIYE
jgi:type IV pilus assembly protein PilY1